MRFALGWLALAVLLCAPARARDAKRQSNPGHFRATAYSIEGITRRGTDVRVGVVAADRAVLPLGTIIEVSGAGNYSGTYLVSDTGEKIDGREIDIYLPTYAEAKRFGVKTVRVRVMRWGDDEVLPTEPADAEKVRAFTGKK